MRHSMLFQIIIASSLKPVQILILCFLKKCTWCYS